MFGPVNDLQRIDSGKDRIMHCGYGVPVHDLRNGECTRDDRKKEPELELERIHDDLPSDAAVSSRRSIFADPREKLNSLYFLIFRFCLASNPVELFYRNHGHNAITRRPGMGCIHNGMDDPVRS